MNRDDVIDVLTVVAAATRRTVGEADVKIWGEIIGGDDKQLALKAVRDHLAECPGVWLEPGHVHQRVRAFVRDEIAREPDAVRDARAEALAVKAAEDAAELAERKGVPAATDGKFRRRPPRPELKVRCAWCHAGEWQPCVIPRSDQRLKGFHPSRSELVAGVAGVRAVVKQEATK